MSTLTQAELDNADRRRRTSGYTRFHAALEDGSLHTAWDWVQHEKCPFNRLGKNGKPPLASAAHRLYAAWKEDASEIGPMPDWWQKIYPEHTQEDWVKRRTEIDQKTLAMTQAIFEACLAHVDWKDWKSPQVEALLGALPPGRADIHPRHGLLQRVIDAGLPLDRLRYMDQPITPAMNSLLRHPYRAEGRDWAAMGTPLDPPGNGPGFLSVLFMQWKRGMLRDHAYWEDTAEQALKQGASINRPVCNIEWIEKRDPKEDLIYRIGGHDYTPATSLLAQVHELDSPRLLASITVHHVNDENRIGSLITLMRRTGEIHARRGVKENNNRKQEHTEQLLRMLEDPAEDPVKWRKMGDKLMETYVKDLWSSIPAGSNAVPTTVRKRLLELCGTPRVDKAWFNSACEGMSLHLRVFELRENLDEAMEDFERLGLPRASIMGQVVCSLVHWVMTSEYRQSKCIAALDLLLQDHDELPVEVHEAITKSVFQSPASALPVVQLAPIVQQLEASGWKPGPKAWGMLRERLSDLQGKDSAEVLMFLGELVARHCPLDNANVLNPVFYADPNDDRNLRSSGYEDVCRWDRAESLRAHAHIARCAIRALPDPNACTWEKDYSLLHWTTYYMKRAAKEKDSDGLAMLLDLVPVLHAAGAHPARELLADGTTPGWVGELPSSHPFHEAWARVEQDELQVHTSAAPARGRGRRL